MARWVPAALVSALVLCRGGVAYAEGPYEGTWNAGPTRIEVQIESWGRDCGPRPQSTTVPSPGNVRVTQNADHLSFHGRAVQRTDRCWSENRAVRRVSSTYQDGMWRTVCRTPEDDPRSETGTYTLRAAGEDRLELVDQSRYDWQLNESRCVGSIVSRQTFTRVATNLPASSHPELRSAPPEEQRCTPGAPARMRIRPADATVEPGGEVRFRAQVVDASGCPVRGRTVRWDLVRPAARSGELHGGVFTAAATAADAEGEFGVVARSDDLEARATVVVRTADLSDLIAKRTSGGVVQAADADEDATSESAAGLVARRGEQGSSLLWPAVGAGAALVLLLGASFVLLARRVKKQRPCADDDEPVPAVEKIAVASARSPVPPRQCPVCHKEFEDPAIGFCPVDGAQLGDAGAPEAGQALICPTCRRGFSAGIRYCPKDSDELLPYDLFVQRHRAKEAGAGEKTKICPKCGDRYARTVTFCGKDGAELVLVN